MTRSRRWRGVVVAALGVAIVIAVYILALAWRLDAAQRRADEGAALFAAGLGSALERFEHLPFVLAQDPRVAAAAAAGAGSPEAQALSRRFDAIARRSGADAVYLMDATGLTLAASNWAAQRSFVGESYGFRPYFRDALAGDAGRFFAIGATTGEPGWFIAEGVLDADGRTIGVVAVKVDLRPIEARWAAADARAFVVNGDGVVVLSSRPEWRYRAVRPIGPEARAAIDAQRQFGDLPLDRLGLRFGDGDAVDPGSGARYLLAAAALDRRGWRVYHLAPRAEAVDGAAQAAAIVAAVLLAITVAALTLRSARIGRALVASRQNVDALRALNQRLEHEIAQRRQAEDELRDAQNALERRRRLAALGELSAAVAHELSQPVAAMKTDIAAARLGGPERLHRDAEALLQRLDGLLDRMIGVTRQMKVFARRPSEDAPPTRLAEVVEAALGRMTPLLREQEVEIAPAIDADVWSRADASKVEQVLVNLIDNALHAVRDQRPRRIDLRLRREDGSAIVEVEDNGDGWPDDVSPDQLFEPFFTTKPSGEGLGLGLALSAQIVEAHGGRLSARRGPGGGAVFEVRLPMAESQDASRTPPQEAPQEPARAPSEERAA